MMTFQPLDGARFLYRADFSVVPYANISFYTDDEAEILFHLSLRADEGRAVVNRRVGLEDTDWIGERARKITLPAQGCVGVELQFTPAHVTIVIDGAQIARYGARALRGTSFPRLRDIALVDFQGGVQTPRVLIGLGEDAPKGLGLWLNDRFEIRGRLHLPNADIKGLHLALPDGQQAAGVIVHQPKGAGPLDLRAVLPGRVWDLSPGAEALTLTLCRGDGTPLPHALTLSRTDLAARIAKRLTGADLRADAFAAMQVAEHVRFAGLEPDLPAEARRGLSNIAEFYGLHSFLHPEAGSDAALEAAVPDGLLRTSKTDPELALVQKIQSDFGQALRDDPNLDAIGFLRTALAAHRLSPDRRRFLCVMLSETFCNRGEFEALYAFAKEQGVADMAPKGEPWHDSAILPFLWMNWQIDLLCTQMETSAELTDGWVVTPALAWVARAAIDQPYLAETAREAILYAYMLHVDLRGHDYWERGHCLALTQTAVALLAARARLADYIQEQIEDFALRAYGLSRQFWELVDQAETAGTLWLSGALPAARAAFVEIQRQTLLPAPDDRGALARAIRLFDTAQNLEVPRLRRELLGPAGVAQGAPTLADLTQSEVNTRQSLIRHMAFPGAPEASPAMAAAAARALPGFYDEVSRAPYYRQQLTTSRQLVHRTARAAAPGHLPEESDIDAMGADLAVLASDRSQFLGLGLGLSMVGALIRFGALDGAERLFDHVRRMEGTLPEDDLPAMARAPAVVSALFALRESVRPAAPALTDRILSHFEAAFDNVPAAAPGNPRPWDYASPLLDTIVTVFSCKPNLDTRVQAMRDGWLSTLKRMGVPYVVVVGDGDGQQIGDVVHLEAPDDYEGLPQKTLATVKWVHDNTPFSYMLKIDDDCFLNADEFFHSQSYRKFDYYGRVLTRRQGEMNRSWHCEKASSPRGQLELDKSPEPAIYTDGGSGYTLSRRAMAQAMAACDTPEGQHLIQTSFMEDKLLGDLLALRGIEPADEDYRMAIRRRTYGPAIPVSLWVNSFNASRAAPVKLIHLDAQAPQAEAMKHLNGHQLTPKKIWPSYQDVQLVYQSNALEMISTQDKLDRAKAAPVAVVACMRNEMFMLPHFLDHYRKMGVESFLIADNCSDDGTLEYLAQQPDVALFSVDTDYKLSRYGVAWQQALMSAFRRGKWSLVADADELLALDANAGGNLPALLASDAFKDAEAARIFMLDMYPQGRLEEADFTSGDPFAEAGFVDRAPFRTNWPGQGPYSNMPTWTSALRHRLIPGSRNDLFVAQKIALLKYQPWMRLSAGLHFLGDVKVADRELLFAHFKYNAAFRSKARAEVSRRQHFNDAEEYRKYLALVSEGRDVIYDADVSVRWNECDFVKDRLG